MPKVIGAVLALCLAGSAQAASPLRTLTLKQSPIVQGDQGLQDIFGPSRRSTVSVIASDALYGGLVGLAIGAGVALLSGDFNSGGNWGRDLAVGAGAGLIIGGIFGAVDVAANSDRSFTDALPVERNRGFGKVGGFRAGF